MIEIHNIKLSVQDDKKKLDHIILKKLHIKKLPKYIILKRSIDARKKPNIYYIYTIGVFFKDEETFVHGLNNKDIMLSSLKDYILPTKGTEQMNDRPVVIGSGPAGLFSAWLLAKSGYAPIVIERGEDIESRNKTVQAFFSGEPLNPESNVQFGEGGAGTFSDGKLNTQVKDKFGRIQFILKKFVEHGAPKQILYDNKPHVGTDILLEVIKGIRNEIKSYGGDFYFNTKAIDFIDKDFKITQILVSNGNEEYLISTQHVILAIGHSARDTFYMLHKNKVTMKQKNFAMGVRVEHPAKWIQDAMYGENESARILPAAPYKLTHQTSEHRGVYTFCMCPGGYVVNASSEPNHIAVNGMSYSGRNGINSNSAVVVQINQEDFNNSSPLAGIEFQRNIENQIYLEGEGKIVTQRFEDFCKQIPTKQYGKIHPEIKGEFTTGNLSKCLPDFMTNAIIESIRAFDKKIPNFAHNDVILSGVESRTSSPVKIERNLEYQANIEGLYPCGEGAGYAGGIISAAVDGLKVAESIIQKYAPYKDRKDIL